MDRLDRLKCVQCKLIESVENELEYGIEGIHTSELGEVIDMIKDLSQTEKYIMEARYYELVSDAMEESDNPEEIKEHLAIHNKPVTH